MYRFIILALMFVLYGCSTPQPIERIVTKTQTKVLVTPSNLLKPCFVHQPPSDREYVDAEFYMREDILTNYVISLLGDLKNCNDQLVLIRELQDKQIKLYGDNK